DGWGVEFAQVTLQQKGVPAPPGTYARQPGQQFAQDGGAPVPPDADRVDGYMQHGFMADSATKGPALRARWWPRWPTSGPRIPASGRPRCGPRPGHDAR